MKINFSFGPSAFGAGPAEILQRDRVRQTDRRVNRTLKTTVLWTVVLYCLVEVRKSFRGACCLHHQGNEAVCTSETSVNFKAYCSGRKISRSLIYDTLREKVIGKTRWSKSAVSLSEHE
jgi:hypothetical protein